MKKYLVLLFMIFMAAPAAATENPFFLCFDNQAGFQFGQSTGPGNFWNIIPGHEWKIEPFQIFLAQYSQPAEFFRIPARMNLHLGGLAAYGSMAADYRNPLSGISWDVSLFNHGRFYAGAGLGGYIKLTYYGRQDSLFVFGEKIFLGYRMNENLSFELYTQHFDDAGLTPVDGGYNFLGITALWNF